MLSVFKIHFWSCFQHIWEIRLRLSTILPCFCLHSTVHPFVLARLLVISQHSCQVSIFLSVNNRECRFFFSFQLNICQILTASFDLKISELCCWCVASWLSSNVFVMKCISSNFFFSYKVSKAARTACLPAFSMVTSRIFLATRLCEEMQWGALAPAALLYRHSVNTHLSRQPGNAHN